MYVYKDSNNEECVYHILFGVASTKEKRLAPNMMLVFENI